MKRILLVFMLFFISIPVYVNADENTSKVFKIISYKYNELSEIYEPVQYWSSVYVNNNIIYTNAHVVLDEDNKPFWSYKICKTIDFKKEPYCFSTWKLLYYDEKNDLAALSISSPWVDIVKKSNNELKIWNQVKVYWYPSNWWNTITYTEWTISWYEDWLYKIDANIDAWNSWGWVFDSKWNFIWMAVSVKVWYSTLWYVIPISKINNFSNKNGESIKSFNKWLEKKFSKQFFLSKLRTWKSSFSNSYINIEPFSKYWFKINNYNLDTNSKYFNLNLVDNNWETKISISNSTIFWNSNIDIDDLYKKELKSSKFIALKNSEYIKKINVKKLKLNNKDILLEFFIWKTDNIVLSLKYKISENNFLDVLIKSDKFKNKSFFNWVKLILKNLKQKSKTIEKENSNLKIDNLSINNNKIFFIQNEINWSSIINIWSDIEIKDTSYAIEKSSIYKDYNLSELLKETYSYSKDLLYTNFYWYKKNINWDYYWYYFTLNNESKSWNKFDNVKKYSITANFFDKKNDNEFYLNTLTFLFDKAESKIIIDDFLNNIKTSSWKIPFELGELSAWDNLVKKEEFLITNNKEVSKNIEEKKSIKLNNEDSTTKSKNDYCSVDLDWVNYKLDPCNINYSMIDWNWDQKFKFKLIPSDSNVSYSFSIYWYWEWFPTYWILWWASSWWASWTQFFTKIFKDNVLDKWNYNWYLKIVVKDSDGLEREMRLNINLDVK